INGAQAFEAFFAGCKQQLIDAFENQELPFEKLVNELAVDRSLNHHPLFQVMFMMLDITPDNFPFYDFDITVEPKERENIIFDVRIVVEQDGDLETIRWDYNDAIFREQTISQLGDHFIALLEQVANQINRPVGRLPLLSPLERQLAVETYGAGTTRIKPDSYQSIPAVFEAQASKTPNIPALLYGDERLSYRDLNRQANLLAHTLMQRGVKTGTRIGIKISRSINQVVGLLGIMKVGGVYVPLVGDLPAERRSAILEDADVQLILTDDGTGQLEIDSLSIDKVMEEGEMHSGWEKNPTVSLSPDSEAYVLYTSGSTGWPKGVVGLHKGVLNRINWLNHTYPFEGDEVVAGKTSLGFVDSVAEIFGTLCLGGTLAMIPDKFVRDPDALVGQLAKHAVTRMIVVPSLLRVMLESNASLEEKLPKLKMWFCGGEELTEKLIVYFYQRLPNRLLVNIYGSSEVSADATWYEVPFQTEEAGLKIPIGRPLDNVQVFILDEHLQPVPTGVAGTIYVAGDGLARGYTDPKIEKGAFSPNIFGDRMMYCMGDIGRFRFVADSEQPVIEFIGRVDSQIKIRGMRVEISEIEAVLEAHPAVNQAVMDWAEQNGEHVLSAYIVLETELSAAECKAHLARKLPSHMIPAQFIEVEKIAFNNSGKVDRLKLRELAQNRTTLLNKLEIVPPRNRMEEKLLEIWLGLLPQENISVEDRFFEIGGHSLLAVRLFAEIEQEFRVKLPVATIFEHGSIEALGKLLEPPETQIGKGINLLVPLQPKGSLPALFLIHARDGFVLKYQQLVDELGDEQQIYGLRSQGIDGDSEPLQSIEEMATQYIAEIKRVQPEGPYHLAGWSLGGWLAFEMAQQLLAAGDALGTLAILDTRAHRHPKYKDVRPAIQQAFQRKARHARLAHHTQKLKEQNFFGSLRYLVQLTQRMFS
ncbi:MAG: amino acid adenylation domain-containing protein, partial [Chloroflexota bacterium]